MKDDKHKTGKIISDHVEFLESKINLYENLKKNNINLIDSFN